jgi:O-antigen/teichoic acid export membrane protein
MVGTSAIFGLIRMLSNNTLVYGLAVIAERVFSFFLLPILAKAISPSEYAIWSQSIVVAGVIVPVVLMGFQTAVVKYFPLWGSRPEVRDSVLLAMLTIILALLTLVSVVGALFPHDVADMAYGEVLYAGYVPLLAVLLMSEALFEFLVGVLRATDRIRLIALYTMLKGVWRIAIFLIALHVTNGNFHAAFLAYVWVQFLFVLLMYVKDIPIALVLKRGISVGKLHWPEVLAFSLPLVALSVMTGLNNFTDRFFLTHFHGLDVVAAYAASYSLASIAAFFYSVLGFTLFPALARYWAQGRQDKAALMVGRVMQAYLIFLLPFIALMTISGKNVLAALTTDAYEAPATVFLLLACNIGLFGLYQIAFYIVLLSRGSVRNMGLMALAAGVNILLNTLLVPGLGMVGAALAGLVSNLLLAGVTLHLSLKALPWHFPWSGVARIAMRAGIMLVFLWVAGIWLDMSNVYILTTIIATAAVLYAVLDMFDEKNSLRNLLRSS